MAQPDSAALPNIAPKANLETQAFWDATAEGRLLLKRLGKVLPCLGQLRSRFGKLPSACAEFLFQFGPRLVPPANVRARLRFGRTNLATARPALRAFARQRHLDSPMLVITSRGSGLPRLRE